VREIVKRETIETSIAWYWLGVDWVNGVRIKSATVPWLSPYTQLNPISNASESGLVWLARQRSKKDGACASLLFIGSGKPSWLD